MKLELSKEIKEAIEKTNEAKRKLMEVEDEYFSRDAAYNDALRISTELINKICPVRNGDVVHVGNKNYVVTAVRVFDTGEVHINGNHKFLPEWEMGKTENYMRINNDS